jgi:ubiquinone/menaquinone biosynthesis C-methylase UbiE
MGFYADRILPRLLDRGCAIPAYEPIRRRVCLGLRGEVVEIGFGSGLNVPFYPAAVQQVTAIEPAGLGWRLAATRMAAATVPIRLSGLDGQALPFPDASFDTALSSWTLCTIPDVRGALGEIHRVLRPEGTLHFLEHGLAPDESVRRWQRRLEPLQKRLVGGCHFTRPIVELITAAGFTITELDVFYAPSTPRFSGALSLGVAAPS